MKLRVILTNDHFGRLVQVRVENIKDPADHIGAVLEQVKPEYLAKTYKVTSWNNPEEFLEEMAKKSGRLLKVRLN